MKKIFYLLALIPFAAFAQQMETTSQVQQKQASLFRLPTWFAKKDKTPDFQRELRSDIQVWGLVQIPEHLDIIGSSIIPGSVAFKLKGKELKLQLKALANELVHDGITPHRLKEYNQLLKKIRAYIKEAEINARPNRVIHALLGHMIEENDNHQYVTRGKSRTVEQEKKLRAHHLKEVEALEKLAKTGSKKDKAYLAALQKLGIKRHEHREDVFAQLRIQQKSK